MALGTRTDIVAGESAQIEILASATAANSAPSGASAGVEINQLRIKGNIPMTIRCGAISTAGSGTMTVTLRVWLMSPAGWFVAKSLNNGNAIAETGTDTIGYSEEVSLIAASRIYLEIVAIAGTNTAVTGYAWVQA